MTSWTENRDARIRNREQRISLLQEKIRTLSTEIAKMEAANQRDRNKVEPIKKKSRLPLAENREESTDPSTGREVSATSTS